MQPTHLKTEVDKYQLSIETCLTVSQVLTIDRKIWRVAGGRLLRQPPVSSRATWRHIYIYWMSTTRTEMQKAADAADISVLFFSAAANFWAILGHF